MDCNTPIDPDLLDESNSNIDEYLCCICQMIPNPQTALEEENCGHLFCNNCLTEWLKSKINCALLARKFYRVIGGVHEVLRMLDGNDGVARFGEAAD